MSNSSDDRARLRDIHPHCPDDEVREIIYGVRDILSLPSLPYLRDPGQVMSLDDGATLGFTEIVQSVFGKCSWPSLIRKQNISRLKMPASLEKYIAKIDSIYTIGLRNKTVYEFYSVNPVPDPIDVDSTLHRFRVALSSALDVKSAIQRHCVDELSTAPQLAPALDWAPAYDSLFLSAWHDELQDTGISISFRPRWAMHPTTSTKPQDLEWPVTVPDVVFSLRLPASSTPKLRHARRYHPAYFFSGGESESSPDIDIPILVVEYNKLEYEESKDDDEEDRPHRDHLTAGMTAALHMYTVLGLATPLCGIFMNKYTAHLFLGTPRTESGRIFPIIQEITTNPDRPFNRLDLLHHLLHVLHLRTILSNLHEIAKSIVDELSSNANTLYKWVDFGTDPKQPGIANQQVRRQIDSTRPPLVVDDVVSSFLFRTERDYITSWLHKANITFLAKEPLSEAPIHIRLWMQPFDRQAQLSSPLLSEAIEDSKKVLPGRAHDLVAPFLSTIQRSAQSSVSAGPATNVDVPSLSSDVLSALTFCLYARDISQDSKVLSTHWVALYNLLLSRAWRSFETTAVFPRWHPQWNVHRSLRRHPGPGFENNLLAIHPNFAFIICLHNQKAILSKHQGPHPTIEHLLPEFAVTSHTTPSTGISDVQIPTLIVEYVLTANNPDERFKHQAHLFAALRSALALWEVHHVEAPVIGLLMEHNIVTTMLAWIDKNKQCIIREVSDYRLNVLDPYDAFRLFNLMKCQGSAALKSQIHKSVDAAADDAFAAVLSPDYKSWRADKLVLSTDEEDRLSRVSSWTTSVQVSSIEYVPVIDPM